MSLADRRVIFEVTPHAHRYPNFSQCFEVSIDRLLNTGELMLG